MNQFIKHAAKGKSPSQMKGSKRFVESVGCLNDFLLRWGKERQKKIDMQRTGSGTAQNQNQRHGMMLKEVLISNLFTIYSVDTRPKSIWIICAACFGIPSIICRYPRRNKKQESNNVADVVLRSFSLSLFQVVKNVSAE